jgi:hypothetical protein
LVRPLFGERLGVAVRLPRHSLPLPPTFQRLQEICDRSHLRMRKVMLRGKWWRRDNGLVIARP